MSYHFDSAVYARQLLAKGLGFPLWCPEPYDDLPDVYKQHGYGCLWIFHIDY
jgi:hypothetical protein